jgi:hypothetical protein
MPVTTALPPSDAADSNSTASMTTWRVWPPVNLTPGWPLARAVLIPWPGIVDAGSIAAT